MSQSHTSTVNDSSLLHANMKKNEFADNESKLDVIIIINTVQKSEIVHVGDS